MMQVLCYSLHPLKFTHFYQKIKYSVYIFCKNISDNVLDLRGKKITFPFYDFSTIILNVLHSHSLMNLVCRMVCCGHRSLMLIKSDVIERKNFPQMHIFQVGFHDFWQESDFLALLMVRKRQDIFPTFKKGQGTTPFKRSKHKHYLCMNHESNRHHSQNKTFQSKSE